jgi:hypothetical protein
MALAVVATTLVQELLPQACSVNPRTSRASQFRRAVHIPSSGLSKTAFD